MEIEADQRAHLGIFYRSDHFSFARVGIPAFSIEEGQDLLGKPPGTGAKVFAEWNEKRYHQPADQYHDDWDVSGMVEYARFGMLIATDVANSPNMPTWRAGDEFLPARQKSGVK